MFKSKLAVELLEDRCRSLEHRCEDLERSHKGLALEWEELYDKVRHQMSRMSRRIKVEKPNGSDVPVDEPQPEYESGLDPISAGILRRRAGTGGRPQ